MLGVGFGHKLLYAPPPPAPPAPRPPHYRFDVDFFTFLRRKGRVQLVLILNLNGLL
jgi:hypothetical protein